jgi:SM-20-related protein
LGERGFFVRDGFLPRELAQSLHAASKRWLDEGRYEPAGIGRGAQRRLLPELRGDLRLWVPDELATGELAELRAAFTRLREVLNASAYLGLQRLEIQLAVYPGTGARYDRHLDALAGATGRRATAIAYLNPRWSPPDGGQLRLHLPSGVVDIEPVLNRLVVFLSERVEHEVLPAFAERFAATGWFSP